MRTTSVELMDSPEARGPDIAMATPANAARSPVMTIPPPTAADTRAPATPASAQTAITPFNSRRVRLFNRFSISSGSFSFASMMARVRARSVSSR